MITGYLAPEGYADLLEKELKNIRYRFDRLFVAEGPLQTVHWVQNIWLNPVFLSFSSLSRAAEELKKRGKLWAFYPYRYIRKGKLITSKLAHFSPKPLSFPALLPKPPLGSWLLTEEDTMLVSSNCSSPFPHGEVFFQEDLGAPGRAYLKLWEILTKIGQSPGKGDVCLEVGASPGSWTKVLQTTGAEVIAVDRAPLDPEVSSLPSIRFLKKDAFTLQPEDFPEVTWIFSDVICYPDKLLEWIHRWLRTGRRIRWVCTLKFQGKEGYGIIREYEKIPHSRLEHLFYNKHELTWTLV